MNDILFLDNNTENHRALKKLLEPEFVVTAVANLDQARELLQKKNFSVLIMEYFFNEEPGARWIQRLSECTDLSKIPFVFKASSSSPELVEEAFRCGASDLITGPFFTRELLLRLRVHNRVHELLARVQQSITFGNMELLPDEKAANIDGKKVRLSAKEFAILYLLCKKPHQVVTTEELIQEVWSGFTVSTGNIYTQVYNLKKKLSHFRGEILTLNRIGLKIILR